MFHFPSTFYIKYSRGRSQMRFQGDSRWLKMTSSARGEPKRANIKKTGKKRFFFQLAFRAEGRSLWGAMEDGIGFRWGPWNGVEVLLGEISSHPIRLVSSPKKRIKRFFLMFPEPQKSSKCNVRVRVGDGPSTTGWSSWHRRPHSLRLSALTLGLPKPGWPVPSAKSPVSNPECPRADRMACPERDQAVNGMDDSLQVVLG